jgi:hypothetical protein
MNTELDKINFILATDCERTTSKPRFFRAYALNAYAEEVSIFRS